MLNSEAKENLKMIQKEAFDMWGKDCKFELPQIIDSPYPEFELHMILYGKVEVGIYYDRSAIDFGIKQDKNYILLEKFTDKQVDRGINAMNPTVLRRNFKILDDVVSRMVEKE